MIKAVGYMRCSGMGQDTGDTWDRQDASIRSYASLHGFEIERMYREVGISGKTEQEERPAFQEMIGDLLANGCRTVILESMDRLAREYRVQEQLIIYIASKEIQLISANTGENITEAMAGDPMRRAMIQIQGIFAELDKNLLVAKLRKARQRKKDRNGSCEGQKPFGFYENEKQTLKKILDIGSCPIGLIVETLNHFPELYPTRSGRPWNPAVVARIIKRETVHQKLKVAL
jgi:DNA invertase Pin-like site-specific DNA recombinase